MKEIAVYGKGGIGKSTLASNISAALALKGSRVLQIGCDPKHDSTRLLMHGERITTVLDYIRDTAALDQKCEDILFHGFSGTGCIEAGGPKPGVGCAGRGIITAFELLDRFHIKENYDTIVYDVLGDVVCGGFAVPIRREYANEIFIVTSGEYMSIYAANNILRGISNYDTDTPRIAGLIFNSRNVKGESERVRKFADAVGLPVFAEIPRSEVFAECERQNITAVEAMHQSYDEAVHQSYDGAVHQNPVEAVHQNHVGTTVSHELSDVASTFTDIADRIRKGPKHFMAHPLSDEELESLIMGTVFLGNNDAADNEKGNAVPGSNTVPEGNIVSGTGTAPGNIADDSAGADSGTANSQTDTLMSKNVIRDEPLHGCAFNGAVCMSIHIKDAVVLMHAPKSCAFISWQTVSSTGRRSLYERGALLPSSLLPGLDATDMTESDMVFGGTDRLLEKVREITSGTDNKGSRHKAPKALIVISACPAGIIGDDIDRVKELSTPECPVITVKADGNLSGDYLQGMLMAYTELAKQIIDPALKSEPDTVNVVFEKVVTKNAESNFQTMKAFLDRMGIRVNCRFLYDTSFDSVRKFCTAGLNLLAYKDFTGNILEKFFRQNYGSEFLDVQFPVGYEETETWIRKVAEHFGKQEEAESIIAENREKYYSRIRELKPVLEGKKLFIVTFNHELDWILRAALDTGMEIVKIGVLNFSQDEGFRTSIPEIKHVDVVENYDREQRIHDIETLKPDIVLGNYITEKIEHKAIFDTIPMCPDVGFFSGLDLVCRWSGLFKSENEGEWRNDRELFEKYYA